MEKKKVIVTLCRVFPKGHRKAGEATDFEAKVKDGRKIHTIRYNGNDVWAKRYKDIKEGRKYLSLRQWTGRPYNSEQREIAKVEKIWMQKVTMTYSSEDSLPQVWIDGKPQDIETVSKNDGMTVEEFVEWFFGNSKENIFEGVVIQFTDFKY